MVNYQATIYLNSAQVFIQGHKKSIKDLDMIRNED